MLRSAVFLLIALTACLFSYRAAAESCTTQAQMEAPLRDGLAQQSLAAGKALIAADNTAIAAASAPEFASGAQATAATLSRVAHGATVTIDGMWILDAGDLAANQTTAQFFCGIANGPAHATFAIPSLPAGRYAAVFLHASGLAAPQQIGLVLKDLGGDAWKIAGFSYRPLTLAGHDTTWYWSQARAYAKKKETWNAYFYYATAVYLAVPVNYVSTGNLEKLLQEQQGSSLPDLPRAGKPLQLSGANGAHYQVTDLSTDGSLGGLDLVIRYTAADVSDPAAARQQNIEVMRAMLAAHPELQSAFHGLWVYAVAPGQAPFGIELPMSEIH
jgi:hypothetical protein